MGKYDNITGRTVDKIWDFIHHVEKVNDNVSLYRKVHKNTKQIKFKLKLDVKISSDGIKDKPFEFDAGVYSDLKMPVMEMSLHINPSYGKSQYCKINSMLNDVIRHEIEHLLQAGVNRKKGKVATTNILRYKAETSDMDVRMFNYLKLKDEIPANVFGMYRQAKLEKKPITEIFDMHLKEYALEYNLSTDQAKHIFKKWYKFSKKHLPKAQYAKIRYS